MKTIVAEIINDWDPLNLFPGAPKDEYKDEIQCIASLLEYRRDVKNIAHGIKNVFTENFGDDVFRKNFDECLIIANAIIERIQ